MQQNRLLLFDDRNILPRTAIFAVVSSTINFTQIVGRPFDENVSSNLLLTQELLSVKLGIASNTLALSQVIAAIRRNVPEESELDLTQSVATSVDYVRSPSNTLNLTQSVTGYLSNRIENASCEDPIEDFTLEEV